MISLLTGKDDARLLAKLDAKEISEEWQHSLGVNVGSTFRNLGTVYYWKCPTTGFCWYTPAQAAGGGELYAQLEKFDWYYMEEKWEFTATLGLLKEASVVLEVGAGEGHFLRAARNRGHSVKGVELNPQAAARARAMDFEIFELMLHELKEQTDQRFDVVCAFQVLEHVPDPRQFLEGLIGMLKPGGKIVLAVPNAEVMRRVDPYNKQFLNRPPHHMGHWDENVFRALEKLLPVKVCSVHREPLATFHVGWIVNGYLRNVLSPLGKTVSRLLVNRYSTLPLQLLVHAGFGKHLPGHTLLVELEYLPN